MNKVGSQGGPTDFFENLRRKAAEKPARVLLPEAQDPRIRAAARMMLAEGVATPVLLTPREQPLRCAWEGRADLDGIELIDASAQEVREDAALKWRSLRNLDIGECRRLMDTGGMHLATALLHCGRADAMVAGAASTTADVIRPSLEARKLGPGIGPVTSCFIMAVPDCPYGEDGVFVFTDCGIHPKPDPAMLARIAISAAGMARDICGFRPRAAVLSFSTMGSAAHESADAARTAVEIARAKAPWLQIDGELQADAALVPSVGLAKAGGDSEVAGKANVLVFPDLASGNIAYKLVERLAKARAVGPVFCGLTPPVNDLSRGCSAEDIVDMAAVSSLQVCELGDAELTP